MSVITVIILIISLLFLIGGFLLYVKSKQSRKELVEHEKETERKMYELAILKEIGDRTGYSLNIQNIVDIITGSLHQFMEYGAVSYMLLQPEKIIFKVHLEKSVSRGFIDDIQDRMLKSLSALMNQAFDKKLVEEVLTGAIVVDEFEKPVQSFFNIPLVIGEKVVGVFTVAHTEEGLYKEDEMTILYKITKQASDAVSKLQEVVRTEQEKLNAMVESINEGVLMTDTDYRVVVVNPSAKKTVGIEDKKEITIFDFIDNLGGVFDIRGKLEESVELDKVLSENDVLIRDRFYQIFVAPVKSSVGILKDKILGGVVIFHDITNEKEVEKMREDFTSMMVHELRSPLDGIKKISEVIRSEKSKQTQKESKQLINLIYDSAENMLELVNDLLDAAKLEAGKFELELGPADITKVIHDRISFLKISVKNAKLHMKTQIAKDVPRKVNFDIQRISQILNNFISNSIKFTRPGGSITLQSFGHTHGKKIAKEARDADIQWLVKDTDADSNLPDGLIVAVTDTGIGIPCDNMNELFSKFKQFKESTTSDIKGTGLGLVIAKGMIEAHGGTIGVASEDGGGSTFYFHLPFVQQIKSKAIT